MICRQNLKFICSYWIPENVVLILHETPGNRYSLIPGDALSKGSKIEKVKLGEMKTLGIDIQKIDRNVQREHGNCKDYDPEDSPAKCYMEKVLKGRFQNDSVEAKEICSQFAKFTQICLIPQAINILKDQENATKIPQCVTEAEYSCMMNLLTTMPTLRSLLNKQA